MRRFSAKPGEIARRNIAPPETYFRNRQSRFRRTLLPDTANGPIADAGASTNVSLTVLCRREKESV
jgi:hypothetical protein